MSNWQIVLAVAAMITATITIFGAVVAFGRWTGKVDATLDEFKRFAKDIRDRIDTILLRLPPTPGVAGKSPLQLTDLGERMADFINAKTWANQAATIALHEIVGMQPFEVDLFSRRYVRERLVGNEWASLINSCAYEHGTTTEAVLDVLQVVLRDEFLRLRDQGSTGDPPP